VAPVVSHARARLLSGAPQRPERTGRLDTPRGTQRAILPLARRSAVEKLVELVRQFEAGEIVLPIMQREYVWKAKKVEALLDSLYHKYR